MSGKSGPKTLKSVTECRFALASIRKEIKGVKSGDALEHKQFDVIKAFASHMPWRKNTTGARLAKLLVEIADGYSQGNGNAEFSPDPLLALVEVMDERVLREAV